jgi:hypothetical protein
MKDYPWIWFEVEDDNTMSPSPTILTEGLGQHLTYKLYAIIYLGGNHFTARVRDPSGDWWDYDGTRRFGAARHEPAQTVTDLLHSGSRPAAFFIYRRSDD